MTISIITAVRNGASTLESCLASVQAQDSKWIVRTWRSGGYDSRKLYWGWMPPHPTFFVRRRVYERFGGFNTALGSAADYELMLRFLLKHRIRAVYIPEVLVHMRVGGMSNATLRRRLRANRLDREAWRVNGLRPYPWTIWAKPIRKLPQWVGNGVRFPSVAEGAGDRDGGKVREAGASLGGVPRPWATSKDGESSGGRQL